MFEYPVETVTDTLGASHDSHREKGSESLYVKRKNVVVIAVPLSCRISSMNVTNTGARIVKKQRDCTLVFHGTSVEHVTSQ